MAAAMFKPIIESERVPYTNPVSVTRVANKLPDDRRELVSQYFGEVVSETWIRRNLGALRSMDLDSYHHSVRVGQIAAVAGTLSRLSVHKGLMKQLIAAGLMHEMEDAMFDDRYFNAETIVEAYRKLPEVSEGHPRLNELALMLYVADTFDTKVRDANGSISSIAGNFLKDLPSEAKRYGALLL